MEPLVPGAAPWLGWLAKTGQEALGRHRDRLVVMQTSSRWAGPQALSKSGDYLGAPADCLGPAGIHCDSRLGKGLPTRRLRSPKSAAGWPPSGPTDSPPGLGSAWP